MAGYFFIAPGHSVHLLGHIAPGLAFMFPIFVFWINPWGSQQATKYRRNLFPAKFSCLGILATCFASFAEYVNDPGNLHGTHHILMYLAFTCWFSMDLAVAHGKLFPGASHAAASFAFANEAILFLGHEVSGMLEARMHTMVVFLALGSSLFSLCGFWSRIARAAALYCAVLQGAVMLEMGIWLDSFHDQTGNRVWGPSDEVDQRHKYMMQAHMLLSVTAMALMVLWISRLSATFNISSSNYIIQHECVEEADNGPVCVLGHKTVDSTP